MNAASEDIKDMLAGDSSLGLTFGTDLFIAKMPTAPNNCVVIVDTPGGIPDLSLDSRVFHLTSVQIQVRNTDYRTGWTLLNDILGSLHGRAQQTWNATLYSAIWASTEASFIRFDDKGRALFSSNFNMKRR
jgi:hypothetical protein